MKKIVLPLIMMLLSTLMIAIIPTEAEAAIYEDTIRLHILAPSDSKEDQALKLEIRDMILEKYSASLEDSADILSAKADISALLPSIEADCRAKICELQKEFTVKAELCEEWYNTREYKNFTLPQGYYTSLKITLGQGEGANWWCVMYPPMCLELATGYENEYTNEEYRLISPSGYRIKFKLLELASELARGGRD